MNSCQLNVSQYCGFPYGTTVRLEVRRKLIHSNTAVFSVAMFYQFKEKHRYFFQISLRNIESRTLCTKIIAIK